MIGSYLNPQSVICKKKKIEKRKQNVIISQLKQLMHVSSLIPIAGMWHLHGRKKAKLKRKCISLFSQNKNHKTLEYLSPVVFKNEIPRVSTRLEPQWKTVQFLLFSASGWSLAVVQDEFCASTIWHILGVPQSQPHAWTAFERILHKT